MKLLTLVSIAGCGTSEGRSFAPRDAPPAEPPVVLEPDFVSALDQGWMCNGWGQVSPPDEETLPPVTYVAVDANANVRVEIWLERREGTFTSSDPRSGDRFRVYTGIDLFVEEGGDKCDDVILAVDTPRERVDYGYGPISGTATVVDEPGEPLLIGLAGIVLRADNDMLDGLGASGWEDLPDIVLADGALPPF